MTEPGKSCSRGRRREAPGPPEGGAEPQSAQLGTAGWDGHSWTGRARLGHRAKGGRWHCQGHSWSRAQLFWLWHIRQPGHLRPVQVRVQHPQLEHIWVAAELSLCTSGGPGHLWGLPKAAAAAPGVGSAPAGARVGSGLCPWKPGRSRGLVKILSP